MKSLRRSVILKMIALKLNSLKMYVVININIYFKTIIRTLVKKKFKWLIYRSQIPTNNAYSNKYKRKIMLMEYSLLQWIKFIKVLRYTRLGRKKGENMKDYSWNHTAKKC